MKASVKSTTRTAEIVRQRIQRGGERLWRLEDFRDLPFTAVAKTLSRLAKSREIERLSKGIYFRGRPTAFGLSRPNPAAIRKLVSPRTRIFPSGIAAANLLGFTTQNATRGEVATSALSLPRKLIGADTLIHTKRPEAWSTLSDTDAALLDFLRRGGETSELSPKETIRRTLALISEPGRYRRLLKIADTEPPRLRAMLGALGQTLAKPAATTDHLRASINPFSRFDFGVFAGLQSARSWQAKEYRQ